MNTATDPAKPIKEIDTEDTNLRRWKLVFAVLVFAVLSMLWGHVNTLSNPGSTKLDSLPFLIMSMLCGMVLLWHLLRPQNLETVSQLTLILISLTLFGRIAIILLGPTHADTQREIFVGIWAFVPLQPISCFVLLRGKRAILAAWVFTLALGTVLSIYAVQTHQLYELTPDMRYAMGVVGLALPMAILFLQYALIDVQAHDQTRLKLDSSRELLATELSLRETREQLDFALQASGCGTWAWDADGNHVSFDDTQHELYGLVPGEFDGRRQSLMKHVHPDDRPRLIAALDQAIRSGESYQQEYRVILPSGKTRDLSDRGQVQLSENGKVRRMIGVSFDVSEARRQFRATEAKQLELELLANALPSAVAYLEQPSNKLSYRNAQFDRWFHTNSQEKPDRLPQRLQDILKESLIEVLGGKRTTANFSIGQNGFTNEGHRRFKADLVPHKTNPLRVDGIYLVIADVTQQYAQQISLEREAMLDPLTNLHNRRYLDENLKREWRRSQRNRTPISILMADIDYFKKYNDRFGHEAGDHCLRQIAQTLRQHIHRPADIVARYGGEEFIIVLPETPVNGALLVAEQACLAIEHLAISHPDNVFGVVTISMGVAGLNSALKGEEPEMLVNRADTALYEAKFAGRNHVALDSASKNQSIDYDTGPPGIDSEENKK